MEQLRRAVMVGTVVEDFLEMLVSVTPPILNAYRRRGSAPTPAQAELFVRTGNTVALDLYKADPSQKRAFASKVLLPRSGLHIDLLQVLSLGLRAELDDPGQRAVTIHGPLHGLASRLLVTGIDTLRAADGAADPDAPPQLLRAAADTIAELLRSGTLGCYAQLFERAMHEVSAFLASSSSPGAAGRQRQRASAARRGGAPLSLAQQEEQLDAANRARLLLEAVWVPLGTFIQFCVNFLQLHHCSQAAAAAGWPPPGAAAAAATGAAVADLRDLLVSELAATQIIERVAELWVAVLRAGGGVPPIGSPLHGPGGGVVDEVWQARMNCKGQRSVNYLITAGLVALWGVPFDRPSRDDGDPAGRRQRLLLPPPPVLRPGAGCVPPPPAQPPQQQVRGTSCWGRHLQLMTAAQAVKVLTAAGFGLDGGSRGGGESYGGLPSEIVDAMPLVGVPSDDGVAAGLMGLDHEGEEVLCPGTFLRLLDLLAVELQRCRQSDQALTPPPLSSSSLSSSSSQQQQVSPAAAVAASADGGGSSAPPSPPAISGWSFVVNPRVALELCLRIAELAAASAPARGRAAGGGRGRAERPRRVLGVTLQLQREAVWQLGARALATARVLLQLLPLGPPALTAATHGAATSSAASQKPPGEAIDEAASLMLWDRVWRGAAALLRGGSEPQDVDAAGDYLHGVLECNVTQVLACGLEGGLGPAVLPQQPPPVLTAALSSGLVAALEHRLRRLGRSPHAEYQRMALDLFLPAFLQADAVPLPLPLPPFAAAAGAGGSRMLPPAGRRHGGSAAFLQLLLAFGPPSEVASLEITVAKLLQRRIDRAAAATAPASAASAELWNAASMVSEALPRPGELYDSLGESRGPPPAHVRQLSQLLLYTLGR